MARTDSTERINTAFATLRNELAEMRNQNVDLMKRLISINSSLHEMNRERRMSLSRSSSRSSLSTLLRKRSTESLNSKKDYCSSNDDISSVCSSENDAEIGQPTKIVPSVAMILPEGGSKDHYHNILMVNVRLWKRSVSDDSADDDNV